MWHRMRRVLMGRCRCVWQRMCSEEISAAQGQRRGALTLQDTRRKQNVLMHTEARKQSETRHALDYEVGI